MIVIDLLVIGVLLASGSAYGARRRARQLDLRESRLEAALARAQLDALRLEIQPHFLFNTLNSMAALIRAEGARQRAAHADRPERPAARRRGSAQGPPGAR